MGVGQVQTTLGAVPREIGGDGDERRLGLVAARGGIFVLSRSTWYIYRLLFQRFKTAKFMNFDALSRLGRLARATARLGIASAGRPDTEIKMQDIDDGGTTVSWSASSPKKTSGSSGTGFSQDLQRAVSFYPASAKNDHLRSMQAEAKIAMQNRDWQLACRTLSDLLSAEETPEMLSNRSRCYLELRQPQEALGDAERSLALNPRFAKPYERKGRALMALAVGDETTRLAQSLAAAQAFSTAHEIDASLKHSRDMTAILGSSHIGEQLLAMARAKEALERQNQELQIRLAGEQKAKEALERQNHRLQIQLTAERKAKATAQMCVLQERRQAQDSTLRLNYVRERMQQQQTTSQTVVSQLQEQIERHEHLVKPPQTWRMPLPPDPQQVELVPVDLASSEGSEVVAAFMASLHDNAVHDNVCVQGVQRVQNFALWRSFVAYKDAVMLREGGDVAKAEARFERRWLYHGTPEDLTSKVAQQGFNRSYTGTTSRRAAWGKGCYFARDASYSMSKTYSRPNADGVQHIFACRVVVGEYCEGTEGLLAPPPRHGHINFDSTVDDVRRPRIFVTYNDAQAYPEYLVRFRQ